MTESKTIQSLALQSNEQPENLSQDHQRQSLDRLNQRMEIVPFPVKDGNKIFILSMEVEVNSMEQSRRQYQLE